MQSIATEAAPGTIGPYSQANCANGMPIVSDQLPIAPATGQFAADDAPGQMRQCLSNIDAIALATGTLAEIVAGYSQALAVPYPARSTFQVAVLPKGALAEVEAIIALEETYYG